MNPLRFCLLTFILSLGAWPLFAGVTWDRLEQSIVADPGQKPTRVVFHFTNTGEAPLKIIEIHKCCGLGAEEPPARDFAPGEKGEIVIWVYPKGATHAFNRDFKVTTEDGVTTKFNIHVEIPDSLSLDADALTWTRNEAPTPKSVEIHVKGSLHAITGLTIKNPNPHLITELQTVEPGHRYRLQVTPKSTSAALSAAIRLDAETSSTVPAAAAVKVSVQ